MPRIDSQRIAWALDTAVATVHEVLQEELQRAHPLKPDGSLRDDERARIEANVNRSLDDTAVRLGGNPCRVRARITPSNVAVFKKIELDLIDTKTGTVIRSEDELWRLLGTP